MNNKNLPSRVQHMYFINTVIEKIKLQQPILF